MPNVGIYVEPQHLLSPAVSGLPDRFLLRLKPVSQKLGYGEVPGIEQQPSPLSFMISANLSATSFLL
jgi:hypothetical protein